MPTESSSSVSYQALIEDPSSCYFMHPNENPIPVSSPLNDTNYHHWAREMMIALVSKNKHHFVDGTLPPPAASDALFPAWQCCNTMVLTWLLESICPSISQSVMWLNRAVDVWNDLKERFSHACCVAQPQHKIFLIRQGDSTVSSQDYFRQDYVIRCLKRLNDRLSAVRSQILLMEPLSPIDKGKPRHTTETCYKKHGFPPGYKSCTTGSVNSEFQSSDEDYQYSDQEYSDECFYEVPDSKLFAATAKGPTIKVITKETLPIAQKEDLCTIKELLSVEEHQARRLLMFHRWDKEELARKFGEKGKTSLFAEAGVSEKVCLDSNPLIASSMMCKICFKVVSGNETTRMDCGHCFCNDCWTRHFIAKINEGQSKHIKCMADGCKHYCNEDVVKTQLREEDMAKFDRFLLESYIEDNRRAKWCPSTPHCGNAICVEDDDVLYEVECLCGFQFCFSCLSEPHSPCSCLMRERWAEKSNGASWLKHNTQPCPKCDKLVYKSEGCDSVTCICGAAFRWRAGGREEMAEEANQDESRFTRYYEAHKNSLDTGFRFTESMANMAPYLGNNFWVNDALSTLVRSRRVLSYSYPFVSYLFNYEMLDEETRRKLNLFEYHQELLEKNIDKLSKSLDELFESDEVLDKKTQVIGLSAVIDKFCEHVVYEFIREDLLPFLPHSHKIAPYQLLRSRPQ